MGETLQENKRSEIKRLLRGLLSELEPCGRLLVAFSGGVDSSVVVAAAAEALGKGNVLAVTADSETLPESELAQARQLATSLGVRHAVVETRELDNEDFCDNSSDRCYHCKSELWLKLGKLAAAESIAVMADGVNAEDRGDFRPGIRAGDEAGVLHPLAKIGATKEQVRLLARELGLSNWDKPAQACLSSRFPYGSTITSGGLRRVEQAEEFLRSLGLSQFRVRDHGDTARIEAATTDLPGLASQPRRDEVVTALKALGYKYVTVDLEGFRSGSMNEAIR
ncbi:MAG: ATP-dependent sacrificial sulfur transferase LarE [Actinobacteria bacterium]|nr:ATP-dependent sacrificial sulfur transferase LarE [Actinomycetota bacterium]MCL5882461.1 ATP-dependent sacrificial sulfur transferase LarE [Actinomycetota bacterium]